MKTIGSIFKGGKAALDARKEFKELKKKGEISFKEEMKKDVVSKGATWLSIRAIAVPVMSGVITGIIQFVDVLIPSVDLTVYFTEASINGASLAIVGIAVFWGMLDKLRASAKGLLS